MDMKFKFLLILPLLVAFLQADSVEGSLPNPGPIQVRSNPLAHFSANGIGADADKFRNNADTNSLLTVVNSGRIASHVAGGNGSVRVWSYDEEYTLSELYNITSPHSTPNNDSFGYEIELNGEFLGVGSYYAMESATHAGRYYVYNASTGSLNSDFNYSPQTAQYFGIDSSLGDNFLCVLESGNLGWNTEGGISLYSLDYATNAVSFVEHLSFRYLKPSGYGIYSGALASSDRDLITVQRIEGNEAKLLSAYRIEYQSGEPSGIGLLDSKALPLDFFSYRRDVIDFSGSFAVVSDPFFDDSGRVLVYPFGSQEGFGEGIEIQETNPTSSARFGQSVRLYESEILFVSSPYHATEGCVYIYDISSISSVQLICVLWPPESSGLTQFGSNLYIDGNKLAVSSGANDLLLYDINSLLDSDSDGLLNSVETNTGIFVSLSDTGSNPNNSDTDGDGLSDGDEVNIYSTNPIILDTDSDGLNDGDEVNVYSTNPSILDTDGDGLNDSDEISLTTDPSDSDTDGDTLLDGAETNTGTWISISDTGTDPLSNDSDSDGLNDGVETNTAEYIDASDTGTDPNDSDTDDDGVPDGAETNTDVYVSSSDTGTHPLNTDSDADGYSDYVETNTGTWTSSDDTGTDPNRGDTDNDGIIDGRETNTGAFIGVSDTGTDPHNQDSDGDGFSDQFEVNTSYDPTSASDTPDALTVIRTAVEVDIYAADGGVYRVEYTEDLDSDIWITVEDGIIGNGEIIYRLYSAREYPRRFFRAIRTDQ